MRLFKLMLCLLIPFPLGTAQQFGHVENQEHRWTKFENGMFISMQKISTDPTTKQVEIFDLQGKSLVSMNLLRLVPDARRLSIYDVSARRGGMIAVAAVYENKLDDPSQCDFGKRIRPIATLLFFDFEGRLQSAFALEPSRGIKRLVVDDQSNVWTLTAGLGETDDPSSNPMLVEYGPDGAVKKELLPRSTFPLHAKHIDQSPATGTMSMGFDAGAVWFWLPGSTDFVTVSGATGSANIVQTGLPKRNGEFEPVMVFRKASGHVVAQIREFGGSEKVRFSYHDWSPSTRTWSEFRPGVCDGAWLIGVTGDDQFYDRIEGVPDQRRTDDLCRFSGK